MSKELKIPQSLLEEQLAASCPQQSVWVSANAGSGKTHVLTQRVIRLLLDGNNPDRILCLTFTKAAAANMKNRVFETLSQWTMMDTQDLSMAISRLTGEMPSAKMMSRARQLFAQALDAPGGLKIQTIHAFCESLLHQFPLEANVSGQFSVIHDITRDAMLEKARASIFKDEAGRSAFLALAPHATDSAIETAISEVITNRFEFVRWLNTHGTLDVAIEELYSILGISKADTVENLQVECIRILEGYREFLKSVLEVAKTSRKRTDLNLALALEGFLSVGEAAQRLEFLRSIVFTKDGKFKSEKSLATNSVKVDFPNLTERFMEIGEFLNDTQEKIKSLELIMTSRFLFQIAEQVIGFYEKEKSAQGLLDYDDLIRKSVALFERKDIREWIRYRLDRGIDHILVDEAQDTSPAQWQIINSVTEDFYAGEGASSANRTIFVVGDEKQSIYSFQGADPKEFAIQRAKLESSVTASGQQLKGARLNLSFRSTKDVLHAVDLVFQEQLNAKGLTQSGELAPHDAIRSAEPGEVQVWPLFGQSGPAKSENWIDPIDHLGSGDPAVRLAKRIASTVEDWVGKPLPGGEKPLRYGDILILVRKRDRFITALTRAMKDMGLAVAGADRLRLLEHIAIDDLISVGKFVLLENDDLNLACLLKSVFLNVDDTELFALAHGRGSQSLFDVIIAAADETAHPGHDTARRVLPELQKIRDHGSKLGPFGFFAWFLGSNGGRKKLLGRFGLEAEDVLDAFMEELLDFTRDGGASLETFVARLVNADPEIKRELELDRDEVRILTVHASKGLEAKCVFLVDSCGEAWIPGHRPKVFQLESEGVSNPFVWVPTTAMQVGKTHETTLNFKESAEEEYRRLLYVGMTRAADRLVVCGYHGVREPEYPHWHKMVHDALKPGGTPLPGYENEAGGFRWVSEVLPPVESEKSVDPLFVEAESAEPNWLFEQAPAEPQLPRPLTPSGAHALTDERLKENRRPPFEPAALGNPYALKAGIIMHHLLEILPGLALQDRQDYARRYVDHHCSNWPKSDKGKTISSVLEIIASPDHQRIFTATSHTEVSVIGSIDTKSGPRAISGQIDRLVIDEKEIDIIDYKTNRMVPASVVETPSEYTTQLAIYRHLIRQIYPDHSIRCSILWTSRPELVELPHDLMDEAIILINNG